ncbi:MULTISPECIES: antitoxin Xre/MbcA/ParS toxin-binding domain-containing protein [unclassified Pseudomonas]|uniref:antitoxin Xre/MbcA/ParS toxin-binding domain-containing protein n=1 Tax=unclassified Pseudomonas TaxID=196821 RepID=UPI001F5737BC|nr:MULTISPECIES: antitoxin Xre/MbcA/ParS toxin-binding domain-containing protein [unclassified Pseudomonas]
MPTELLAQTGLSIGSVLTVELINGVMVLHPEGSSLTPSSSAETLRGDPHRAYKLHLEAYLCIPAGTADKTIHERIKAGFPASLLQALCEQGVITLDERNRIIHYRSLQARLAKNQLLTTIESDRMYRAVHVVAMAVAVFHDLEKATRWLSKPKSHLSGSSPFELLSTTSGLRQVEEMLIQVSEGFYN